MYSPNPPPPSGKVSQDSQVSQDTLGYTYYNPPPPPPAKYPGIPKYPRIPWDTHTTTPPPPLRQSIPGFLSIQGYLGLHIPPLRQSIPAWIPSYPRIPWDTHTTETPPPWQSGWTQPIVTNSSTCHLWYSSDATITPRKTEKTCHCNPTGAAVGSQHGEGYSIMQT